MLTQKFILTMSFLGLSRNICSVEYEVRLSSCVLRVVWYSQKKLGACPILFSPVLGKPKDKR